MAGEIDAVRTKLTSNVYGIVVVPGRSYVDYVKSRLVAVPLPIESALVDRVLSVDQLSPMRLRGMTCAYVFLWGVLEEALSDEDARTIHNSLSAVRALTKSGGRVYEAERA
ncbi:MAG: hypothetical protein KDA28_14560 [Phycisphaerales bacterium]|nr:hypothetical protein [Phycisphaerales bacterium]